MLMQVKRCRWHLRMLELMQAEPYPIDINTAKRECLGHGLLQQCGGIVIQQAQHAHEHAHTRAIRPAFAHLGEHLVVDGRPVCTPPAHGNGVLKGSRALFEQGQVMARIEQILLAGITARMGGNHAFLMQHLNDKRIGAQGELARGLVDWHGVAVGLKHHLAVGREGDHAFDTTGQVVRWQWAQEGAFVLPSGPNRRWLAIHRTLVVGQAALAELGIQVVK